MRNRLVATGSGRCYKYSLQFAFPHAVLAAAATTPCTLRWKQTQSSSVPATLTTFGLLRTAGSSDEEEGALHGDGAAAAGRNGSGKQLEAEDLHEGLDAAAAQGLASSEGGAVDRHHGGSDAAASGGLERARQNKGDGGSRKREAERPPQLSEHGDFAKHAAKLPPEVSKP